LNDNSSDGDNLSILSNDNDFNDSNFDSDDDSSNNFEDNNDEFEEDNNFSNSN